MGKIKYIKDIRKFFKESPVVSINSLKKFIKKKDKSYIYLLINTLLKNKEIYKITKGYYSIHDDPSLLVFCLKPAYLGLQDALTVHNLWDQQTNPVIISVKNIRSGVRKVLGHNAVVRKISPKYFFGFDYLQQGDFYFPYSDIEKTFIDMIYFKQPLDEELIVEFKKKIKKRKLREYLRKYDKRFKKRVLGKLKV